MSRTIKEGAQLYDVLASSGFGMDVCLQVLTGTYTMAAGTMPIQILDCNGAGRTVLLPPEAKGLIFLFYNSSGTAVSLTVKEDSNTTTIGTVAQSKGALFFCDGTTWRLLAGA